MINVESSPGTKGFTITVDEQGIDVLREALDDAEKGRKVIIGESEGWLAIRPKDWT